MKRTHPYSGGEKEARAANKKASQILTCGTIPSYTQEELNEYNPKCPSLVYNSTSQNVNVWNTTLEIWEEIGGGGEFVMVATPTGVVSDGTEELLKENLLTKIDPTEDNLAWTITMNWVAAVTNITGTATGISVGDSIGGKLIFRYKKIGGVASIDGVISDTRTGASSLVDNNSYLGYQIGSSDELEIIFTAPTFAGGGSLDFAIKAEIDIVEVTW